MRTCSSATPYGPGRYYCCLIDGHACDHESEGGNRWANLRPGPGVMDVAEVMGWDRRVMSDSRLDDALAEITRLRSCLASEVEQRVQAEERLAVAEASRRAALQRTHEATAYRALAVSRDGVDVYTLVDALRYIEVLLEHAGKIWTGGELHDVVLRSLARRLTAAIRQGAKPAATPPAAQAEHARPPPELLASQAPRRPSNGVAALQSFGRCLAVAASYAELERRMWRVSRLVNNGRRP